MDQRPLSPAKKKVLKPRRDAALVGAIFAGHRFLPLFPINDFTGQTGQLI
jgi:hypothetical protein